HCTQKARVKNEWKLLSRCRCREVVAPVQGMVSVHAQNLDGGDTFYGTLAVGGTILCSLASSLAFFSATVVQRVLIPSVLLYVIGVVICFGHSLETLRTLEKKRK
ncbi:hypothetical protein Tco_0835045, partial [Tanacetum coccineum]